MSSKQAVLIVLLVFLADPARGGSYGGGTGEPNDPYLIYTAEHMQAIGANTNDWDRHFRLMADIDLSDFNGLNGNPEFNNIGIFYGLPFTGWLDGNGHKIFGFRGTALVECAEGAQISNVHMVRPTASYAAIVGEMYGGGTIADCCVQDAGVGPTYHAGCVAGMVYGTITNCHATGYVEGWHSGGLVGCVGAWDSGAGRVPGVISNCSFEGTVWGADWMGGLMGHDAGEVNITNCYTGGTLTAQTLDPFKPNGGLVGGAICCDAPNISKCYSAMRITEEGGGLIGYCYGSVTDSFWDVEISGVSWSDGGTGLTTAQMQTRTTFTDAGWDFVAETANGTDDIWDILEGRDYPRFAWQICKKSVDFDGSGFADIPDLAILLQAWLSADGQPAYNEPVDVSCDRIIDPVDYSLLAMKWLQDVMAPSVPQNLRVLSQSGPLVTLTWDASIDNVAVEGYNIYRDGACVATRIGNFYTESALSPNVWYSYSVSAFDEANNESARSDPLQVIYETGLTGAP